MTSLLGRLLPLFVGARRVEDLFTEAVARLFERRPELCLSWLDDLDLVTPVSGEGQRYIRVTTQKSFVALDEHGSGSRPDLIVEVHHAVDDADLDGPIEVVMLESKIGSWEGQEQLRRYAGHLDRMTRSDSKTLLYITRAYDPKDEEEILLGIAENIRFEQLRWHDFYRFLQTMEKDALVEEVMLFMEEQGMARSYRFSTTDLIALSGVPRALDIFDETLGEEVKLELESFAGNKLRREPSVLQIRRDEGYFVYAPLTSEGDLLCYVGYEMNAPAEYPTIQVDLSVEPGASGRQLLTILLRQIAQRADWQSYDLHNPDSWSGVWRENSLATLLAEEDHVAAVKRFFIESIRQLREELTAFKKEHPDLPWDGG